MFSGCVPLGAAFGLRLNDSIEAEKYVGHEAAGKQIERKHIPTMSLPSTVYVAISLVVVRIFEGESLHRRWAGAAPL